MEIHMKILDLPLKPNYILESAPLQKKFWVLHYIKVLHDSV